MFFNATTFPEPGLGGGRLRGALPAVLADRPVRRRVHRPLVAPPDPGLVGRDPGGVRGGDRLAGGSGNLGLPLYASVLAVLGVNRFFLSSLSAALPHVVADDKLVMANSVSPTAGGIMASVGGHRGLGVHLVTGGGQGGSAVTLLAAGLLPARRPGGRDHAPRPARPEPRPGERRPAGCSRELAAVAAGLAAAPRYVRRRRAPRPRSAPPAGNRLLYGILFLMSILLYRNYFYRLAGANAALGQLLRCS